MQFIEDNFYHLYNRTNNEEHLFRSDDNYIYFLKKYRYYLDEYFDTIAYCLMPTHYHFLVRVKQRDVLDFKPDVQHLNTDVQHLQGVGHLDKTVGHLISRAIQTLQSSYTKAINVRFKRHGSLFQAHYKAKHVQSDEYLITLSTYIHQNPIRSKLTDKAENWIYSSYLDYLDIRKGTLPSKDIILSMIKKDDLRSFTENHTVKID